jgi:hypothetical protein
MTQLSGGCHCGKVRFTVSLSEHLWSALCHCTICQRLGGGIATSLIGFRGGTQKFDETSLDHIVEYASSAEITRKRCRVCGSPVSASPKSLEWWDCPLGVFDRKQDGTIIHMDEIKADCHMFYPSRVVDAFDDDGLPKWKTYPGQDVYDATQ